MMLEEPIVYTLEYLIVIFLGLALENSFGTWEGYSVLVSLVTVGRFIIGTGEGYLVSLSLGFSLGSLIESKNTFSVLTVMLLGASLGLWFRSEVVGYNCSCRLFVDLHYDNCGG